MTALPGRRVTLRSLTPADFPEWSEVRRRNEAWLTPWEPRRPPKQLDPSLHRDAFVARCTSRDRDSAAGVAYGFGVFVDHRRAGEVNLNSVLRGAMQSATVAAPGASLRRAMLAAICRSASRTARRTIDSSMRPSLSAAWR